MVEDEMDDTAIAADAGASSSAQENDKQEGRRLALLEVEVADLRCRCQAQAAEMDYAPAFQMGHPKNFELASRLAMLLPGDIDYVFYTNSGSESVDTALKMALAYHRARGEAHRQRLIGRVRG